jgi:CO/xanthine dehydrogenase FAD-binding subunit
LQALTYARASSVQEAVRMLADGGPTARVLAGGTDIIVLARERRRDVDLFVDIKHIPETMTLSFDPSSGLTVGAATPCYRIYGSAEVREHYPALAEVTHVIGGTAIQGRASLGGNLCNSSPAGDSIPATMVLEGVARVAGPNGEREVPVDSFCTAPGRNVLEPGEFVVSVHFPVPAPGSGAAWQRFIPRNEMDIAVTNAGSMLRFEGDMIAAARIAIGAVAPTPLLVSEAATVLIGNQLSDEIIKAAGAAAKAAANPIEDMRGSVKQRKHLAAVLTERTLRVAAERARQHGAGA